MRRARDQIHLGELIIFRPMPGAIKQVRSIRTPRNAVRKRIGQKRHLPRLVVRIGRHDPKVAEAAAPDGAIASVDWDSGSMLGTSAPGISHPHAAVSPDQRWLATAEHADRVMIFDLKENRPALVLPPETSEIWISRSMPCWLWAR